MLLKFFTKTSALKIIIQTIFKIYIQDNTFQAESTRIRFYWRELLSFNRTINRQWLLRMNDFKAYIYMYFFYYVILIIHENEDRDWYAALHLSGFPKFYW